MWNETAFSKLTGITYPIVQGPFGGGPSSVSLVAAVSNAGGLGSFGMQSLEPAEMIRTTGEIRKATSRPFALNLWMPPLSDAAGVDLDAARTASNLLSPYFAELGLTPPAMPARCIPDLEGQLETLLELRPPVFSFVYGLPRADVLDRCRSMGILTMGTATTPAEARALDRAGVDCIVASGLEAGGHRGSFLRPPEESLIGMFALIPQVADCVTIPFVAAGGIADARGIAASLALGAHGVQIGTAFLACDESNANALHRASLLGKTAGDTLLTRAFTGRLARYIRNRLATECERRSAEVSPYPIQSWLTSQLRAAALAQGRHDLVSLSAGQNAPLVRRRSAADLFAELVEDTPRVLKTIERLVN